MMVMMVMVMLMGDGDDGKDEKTKIMKHQSTHKCRTKKDTMVCSTNTKQNDDEILHIARFPEPLIAHDPYPVVLRKNVLIFKKNVISYNKSGFSWNLEPRHICSCASRASLTDF
jgi:hypothetical protein